MSKYVPIELEKVSEIKKFLVLHPEVKSELIDITKLANEVRCMKEYLEKIYNNELERGLA